MVKDVIGGRPIDITKVDGKIKIIFHPIAKNATKPDANVFTVILSKSDLEKLKKAFWSHILPIGYYRLPNAFNELPWLLCVTQAQIDEQSVGSETYGFDAIRGIQAGREFYVAMCPLKIIHL